MDVMLFELEHEAPAAEERSRHRASDAAQEALMSSHLALLTSPVDGWVAQLARDVDATLAREQPCRAAEQLAAALAAHGHAASLVTAQGGGSGTAAFRNLRHRFLVVRRPPGCGPAAVVDPAFAGQFRLAAPNARYAALQRVLPECFVGTAEQLEQLVGWLCREMHASFTQQGMAVAPWREHAAMLSKWRPRPASCPSSPRAGGGTAAQPGARCSGAADAGCSELRCRSPDSVLVQRAARLACDSAPADCSAPTTPTAASEQRAARTSLLSRSIQAARHASSPAPTRPAEAPDSWWQPRVHVVRRSAP